VALFFSVSLYELFSWAGLRIDDSDKSEKAVYERISWKKGRGHFK
jgi:hypothetical protein